MLCSNALEKMSMSKVTTVKKKFKTMGPSFHDGRKFSFIDKDF